MGGRARASCRGSISVYEGSKQRTDRVNTHTLVAENKARVAPARLSQPSETETQITERAWQFSILHFRATLLCRMSSKEINGRLPLSQITTL